MKTDQRTGFTLIELLIVISIIGVLSAVAIPVLTKVMTKARIAETKASVVWLKTAAASYQTEYGRLPTNQTGADVAIDTDGGDPIVFVLLGQSKDGLNSHGTNFFDSKIAIGRRNGVMLDSSTASLYDSWGNPVHVLLDVDGDHFLENPDLTNADPTISSGASSRLPADVAVYSNGPDGKPGTRDDVVSWR